jgi:hypothetical protein
VNTLENLAMAMTIQSLEKALRKGYPELRFRVDQEAERIEFYFSGNEHYRNTHGEDSLRVALELIAQGEYLELKSEFLYDLSVCQHKGAVSRLLLGTCLRSALIQFSLDENDGEVRASAELVLVDGVCTPKQLRAMIDILMDVVNTYHPHIVRAMESGEISFPNEETLVRPAIADADGELQSPVSVDLGEMLKGMLATSRERGRKMWENAGPSKGPGRHF